jgi:antitoxin component YwqK of YwqJK toxin-antitoxin module
MKLFSAIIFTLLCGTVFSQTDTIVRDVRDTGHIKDGYYINKYCGILWSKGLVKNHRNTGLWKYYGKGVLDHEIEYSPNYNGITECGYFKAYFANGQLKEEGKYDYAASDSIICIDCYKFETWPRDTFIVIKKAHSETSLKVGFWKEYYESGKLRASGAYAKGVNETYSTGPLEPGHAFRPGGYSTNYLKDGEWKCFGKRGILIAKEYYKNGKLVYVDELSEEYYSEFGKKD